MDTLIERASEILSESKTDEQAEQEFTEWFDSLNEEERAEFHRQLVSALDELTQRAMLLAAKLELATQAVGETVKKISKEMRDRHS